MREGAFEDIGNDLHVGMGMGGKAATARDAVIVDDTQRPEAHVVRVVILAERERVAAVEPAEVGLSALIGATQGEHRSLLFRVRVERTPGFPDGPLVCMWRCRRAGSTSRSLDRRGTPGR